MIEIAGGIIIAVIVLVFWAEILAFGAIAATVAALLMIGVALCYFAFSEPAATSIVFAITALAILFCYLNRVDSSAIRMVKRCGEIAGYVFFATCTITGVVGLICGAGALVYATAVGQMNIGEWCFPY